MTSGENSSRNKDCHHTRYRLPIGGFNLSPLILFLCGLCVLLFLTVILQAHRWHRQQRRIISLHDDLERVLAGAHLSLFQSEEDALAHLSCSLTKAVARLAAGERAANEAHRQLADNLADISHQLKTPLTGLRLLLDVFLECDEPNQDIIDNLYLNLDHLEKIVACLLTLARIDAGTLPIKQECVHSERVLEEALSMLDSLFTERKQKYQVTGPPLFWQGDVFWCSEIFINILKNASDHSPIGSVIRIHLEATPLFNTITVQDAGPGIATTDIAHIFKRFYKGQGASKDSIGIGLALARELAIRQGGSLRAFNSNNVGAVFQLDFPPMSSDCHLSLLS